MGTRAPQTYQVPCWSCKLRKRTLRPDTHSRKRYFSVNLCWVFSDPYDDLRGENFRTSGKLCCFPAPPASTWFNFHYTLKIRFWMKPGCVTKLEHLGPEQGVNVKNCRSNLAGQPEPTALCTKDTAWIQEVGSRQWRSCCQVRLLHTCAPTHVWTHICIHEPQHTHIWEINWREILKLLRQQLQHWNKLTLSIFGPTVHLNIHSGKSHLSDSQLFYFLFSFIHSLTHSFMCSFLFNF